jgi:hypothetical protein
MMRIEHSNKADRHWFEVQKTTWGDYYRVAVATLEEVVSISRNSAPGSSPLEIRPCKRMKV